MGGGNQSCAYGWQSPARRTIAPYILSSTLTLLPFGRRESAEWGYVADKKYCVGLTGEGGADAAVAVVRDLDVFSQEPRARVGCVDWQYETVANLGQQCVECSTLLFYFFRQRWKRLRIPAAADQHPH